jgi:hypothetical protein
MVDIGGGGGFTGSGVAALACRGYYLFVDDFL